MKKFASLLSLVLVFSLCLVLVSCDGTGAITGGNKTDFSESQAKRVELRVWMDDDDGNLFSAIEKDFEAKYTNIDVVFQHMATVDAREKLKTYGQSGNGADIFQFPHDHMSQAILDDLVYQLPDDLNTKLTAQMNPVAMDIATVSYNDSNKTFDPNGEEKLYAVPISLESVALYYNIDLLKLIYGEENWEAHANPETFEAFLADIAAYQPVQIEEGVMSDSHYFAQTSHWADQYMLQFIYSAFGWRPFGANGNDDTAVGFEDAKLTSALSWMMETLKPAINSTNHDSVGGQALFEQGLLPFVFTGPWCIQTFKNAGINFGVTTLPTINGNATSTFAGAQMLAAYKYSKNLDEATLFLEYMASVDAQTILYQQEGDLPALNEANLASVPGLAEDQPLQATIEQLKTSIPMPTIPAVTYYWGPGETMVKNIWNSNLAIADQQATAEDSYAASKNQAEN